MTTEEWIARSALGLLNFIALIALLRLLGPLEINESLHPQNVKQERLDQSVGSTRASISLARLLRSMQRSVRSSMRWRLAFVELRPSLYRDRLFATAASAELVAGVNFLAGRIAANIAKLPELLRK